MKWFCPSRLERRAQKKGVYTATSLEAEGLIHFSKPSQVLEVATFIYRGQDEPVLLYTTSDRLNAEPRYDALEPPEAYPHLYGPLNLGAVTHVLDFPPDPDGTFQLPTDISSSVTP